MEHQSPATSARELFGARRIEVTDRIIDSEEALMRCRELTVANVTFTAPRPLWHLSDAILRDTAITASATRPLRAAAAVTLQGCTIDAALACENGNGITLDGCSINSPDFASGCASLTLTDTVVSGENALSRTTNLTAANLELSADRALSDIVGGRVDFSSLTGDEILWNAKDITISDTILDGARIGWYSENLTLTHCVIIGEKPFAYAKGLTLADCSLDPSCTEAFERSEVDATLRGNVTSVKNPAHGSILADSYDVIILDDTAEIGADCAIRSRNVMTEA